MTRSWIIVAGTLSIALPISLGPISLGTLPARASDSFGGTAAGRTVIAIPLDAAMTQGGLLMPVHAQTLRPAPVPNQDVVAPSTGAPLETDASLSPDLFNPQAHAVGDGYAAGSSIEGDHNHRHSTGGGMSLSIPMQ